MIEEVPLTRVVEEYGTPCYVYSRAAIEKQWQIYDQAFAGRSHLICYSVKANSNLAVLNLLAELGSGFDIVSIGELERVLAADGKATNIIFSGVGKKRQEMKRALEVGIKCFNIESPQELHRLNQVAEEMGKIAPIAPRINPDIDAKTHPYISTGLEENKFGIVYRDAIQVYEQANTLKNIDVVGINFHIGSQITSAKPFADAIERINTFTEQLQTRNINIQHTDIGGGLGIIYQDETPPKLDDFVKSLCDVIPESSGEILLEPGRSIVGNAGVLLTQVEYLKENSKKNFAIVDAAMNDLLRPTLYDAWHEILPLKENTKALSKVYDIVGPICESSDFVALDRTIALQQGDLLAICSAGAYGFCLSSNYNSRPRAAEIMIDKYEIHEVRQRESIDELIAKESLIP